MGFTAHESIIAATYGVAKLMLRADEMGQIKAGNYADLILVDGNPIDNIDVLQDHGKLNVIMINGRVHKAGRREFVALPVAGQDDNQHAIVPDVAIRDGKPDVTK
jgi:imidazolonepropionase-like amidohydrolase